MTVLDPLTKSILWRQREYEKRCSGKTLYYTEQQAEYARKHSDSPEELVSYQCIFCGCYHLGHRIGIERQSIERGSHDACDHES